MAFISKDNLDYLRVMQNPEIGLRMLKQKPKKISSRRAPVCSTCNKTGHTKSSPACPVNSELKQKLLIKLNRIMSNRSINGSLVEDIDYASKQLNITVSQCRTLYKDLPNDDILKRSFDINAYFETIKSNYYVCSDCNTRVIEISQNNARRWKNQIVCDTCWGSKSDQREQLWKCIKYLKPSICEICNKIQKTKNDRFQYDHLNMFDKTDSICSMVYNGLDLYDIFVELRKCHVLCYECHQIVTDIETKLGFINIKRSLTTKSNNKQITPADIIDQKQRLQDMYQQTMSQIYLDLKSHFTSKKSNIIEVC
jgi:hypothetical protein